MGSSTPPPRRGFLGPRLARLNDGDVYLMSHSDGQRADLNQGRGCDRLGKNSWRTGTRSAW
jgi:hypothetical protein